MPKILALLMLMALTACASTSDKDVPRVGMPNPASVHCEDLGGTLEMEQTAKGAVGYCVLPSGERVEEWALFRRDRS